MMTERQTITLPGMEPLELPGDAEQPSVKPPRRDTGGKPGVASSLNCEPSDPSPAGGPVIRRLSDAEERAALRLSKSAVLAKPQQEEAAPVAPAPEPEKPVDPVDPGEMRTAQEAFNGANSEVGRIGAIAKKHEADLEVLRGQLEARRAANAEARAAALVGDGKSKVKAEDLSGLEKSVAESEQTLSALRVRWSAAARCARETKKALLELQARDSAARKQSLERRALELEAEVTRTRVEATKARLQADKLRIEAEAIVDCVVSWLRGSPSEIAEQAEDPGVVIDSVELRALLAKWSEGFTAFDERKIGRVVIVDSGAVFFHTRTGKILANDIIETASISATGQRGGFTNRAGTTIAVWKAVGAIQERAADLERTLGREGKVV